MQYLIVIVTNFYHRRKRVGNGYHIGVLCPCLQTDLHDEQVVVNFKVRRAYMHRVIDPNMYLKHIAVERETTF